MIRSCTFRVLWAALSILVAAGVTTPALAMSAAGADRQPITTGDLLRIRTVTDIDMTSDGSRAVFAVRSIETKQPAGEKGGSSKNAQPTYHYRSHLFLYDLLRDTRPRQITFGERSDSSPRLSPDGMQIAFLRKGESDDSAQVWIMPVGGGEARQVTNFKRGARSIEWAPPSADGGQLLVASPVDFDDLEGTPPWPLEAPRRTWSDLQVPDDVTPRPDGTRAEIRAWLAMNAKDQSPRAINRIDFQDETSLAGPMRFRHLFIVQVPRAGEGEAPEPRRITHGFFDHDDARFMPDGKHVVYTAKKPVDRHPDRVITNQVYMLAIDRPDSGSGDQSEVAGEARAIVAKEGWRFRSPQPNRDGSYIAFAAVKQDEPTFRQWRLGVVASPESNSAPSDQPSEIVWLTDDETFDYSVRRFQWTPTRDAIVFSSAIEGSFPLLTISPGLLRPARTIDDVGGLPAGIHAFAAGGGSILYAATTAASPCVLRVRTSSGGGAGGGGSGGDRLVMDLNEWVNDRVIATPTAGWFARPDGTRIQYWVMPPTNMRSQRPEARGQRPEAAPSATKYPLLLQIHGGPQAMWGPGEASMWHEFQLFCSWGYGIVYANPRGSSGYGYEFQRGNFQNWGDGPAGDVLAAVDHALHHHEWADRDRLVVTGGSYAGYLTAWIVAHDHRFKAAAAQRGVYHLPTFFGEGNAWRLVPWTMGGPPFDSRVRSVIERESPFTYVHRIRTPLLILHSDNDLRTGVSQSEMMYRALKHLERPVEYVRYPGEGHDLSRDGDPRLRMDRLNRMIDFFERYIENPREAPVHHNSDQ